jgi:hypothetical protein
MRDVVTGELLVPPAVDMPTKLLMHSIFNSGVITPDDLNAPNNPTMLQIAVAVYNWDMVRYLLEMGANPNITKPPLLAMLYIGLPTLSEIARRKKIFNILIQYPVNPSVGSTVLGLIASSRNYLLNEPAHNLQLEPIHILQLLDELDRQEAMIRENIRQQNLQSIQELRPNDEPLF